jgi:hypothetical protein
LEAYKALVGLIKISRSYKAHWRLIRPMEAHKALVGLIKLFRIYKAHWVL